jgi:hypothetical protein
VVSAVEDLRKSMSVTISMIGLLDHLSTILSSGFNLSNIFENNSSFFFIDFSPIVFFSEKMFIERVARVI